MKNKVLLLPSYFPTYKNEINGSQVKEQAELLSDQFDIRVIYCLTGTVTVLRFYLNYLLSFIKPEYRWRDCSKALRPGKIKADGVYCFFHKGMSSKQQERLQMEAYEFVLNKYIKQGWNPDLIHARTAEYAGVYAASISNKNSIPFLLTENCIFKIDKNLTLNKIKSYQDSIEAATNVAVVSNYLKSWLLTNEFKCDPYVVGNWINEKNYNLKETKTDGTFTIVTVGHTGYTKDWESFFKAIRHIVKSGHTDFKVKAIVALIYDEKSRRFVPDLIKKYELDQYCEVLYEVNREEMPNHYKQSDVFVTTSINETFGIASCEAMFCGLPVVATANGGIDDFITPKNGIKVQLRDFQSVAEAIVSIKTGAMQFDSHIIRESVLSKFGTDAFVTKLSHIYRATINKELIST